jgi:hypothetical protein
MIGSGRRTKLEMEIIYTDVEEHVIRLRQIGRIKGALIAKYKVDQSTAAKWVREVYYRFKASAPDNELREDRRNMMRATLDTIASMALNKSVTLRNPDGSPVLDSAGKVIKVAAPDLKNALDACKQLRDLDGLDAPIRVETTTNGQTTTTLVLGDEERKALEKALRGLG